MGSKTQLEVQSISYSNDSLLDEFGRVFFYDGRVFRAIKEGQEEKCIDLIQSKLFELLVKDKLIPNTWVSEYKLDGFGLVLEHELIQPNRPHNWSFSMYKDAALFVLEFNRLCNQHGFELKDAHPYNIFFSNNRPILIDIGSIMKQRKNLSWVAHLEFVTYFFIQLFLWARGEVLLARKFTEDGFRASLRTVPMTGILDSEIFTAILGDVLVFDICVNKRKIFTVNKKHRLLSFSISVCNFLIRKLYTRKVYKFSITKRFHSTEIIRSKIEQLRKKTIKSSWGEYHELAGGNNGAERASENARFNRFNEIIQLIKLHAPEIKTAIDLAGNKGTFCRQLANSHSLERILLVDYDENAIDAAYQYFKGSNYRVEPFLLNFMLPLEKSEQDFFKSDIAFALAVTHHLILSQRFHIEYIFECIGDYSNKYVAIEFMPLGLWDGNKSPLVPDWYSIDWFRKKFLEHFELIREVVLEANRVLFFGKKLEG